MRQWFRKHGPQLKREYRQLEQQGKDAWRNMLKGALLQANATLRAARDKGDATYVEAKVRGAAVTSSLRRGCRVKAPQRTQRSNRGKFSASVPATAASAASADAADGSTGQLLEHALAVSSAETLEHRLRECRLQQQQKIQQSREREGRILAWEASQHDVLATLGIPGGAGR